MNLSTFLDTYKAAIAQRVVDSYPPRYRPTLRTTAHSPRCCAARWAPRRPPSAAPPTHSATQRGTTVVGEMGTGKTFIATAAAHLAGFQRILVLVPPHLTRKWKREVEATIPTARAAIVTSITALERLRQARAAPARSSPSSPASAPSSPTAGSPPSCNAGPPAMAGCCATRTPASPSACPTLPGLCGPGGHPRRRTADRRGAGPPQAHLCRLRRRPLASRPQPARAAIPLADYVKQRLPGWFDLLIADEVHEYKGRGSAQGIAAGILADVCGTSLALTGTLAGGYASTLFHLLYRFSPGPAGGV